MREVKKTRLHQINLKLWSLIARALQKNVCAKCYSDNLIRGMSIAEARKKATKNVDAHHIFTKGKYHSTEFDLDDAMCLCFYHHRYWIHSTAIPEKERDDFLIWFLGEEGYKKLWFKSRQLVKTNMEFYVENFVRLYDKAMAMNLEPWKVTPRYIVKELYEKVKE